MNPLKQFCTCENEDSDGRGDVLRCPVHGIGPNGFLKRTDEALRISRQTKAGPVAPEG